MPTRQVSDPAAQGQATDTGVAYRATGRCQAVLLRGAVEVRDGRAAPTTGAAGDWIDVHLVHRAQVNHQPVVTHSGATEVVSAAAN